MTDAGRQYLAVPRLARVPGLVHGFGDGGWSEADFLSFAASLGLEPAIMLQVHSDTVHRVEAAPAGKLEGDALMTNEPGILLVVRTADCLPVFLVDAKNRAVAAVHCGWRGTEKRIIEKTVRSMAVTYGSKPGTMLAALGPCIGSACYVVGPEVREAFGRAGFPPSVFTECRERECTPSGHVSTSHPASPAESPGHHEKSLLDLRAANVWLLRERGFKKDNILDSGSACTHCEPSLLSYRRDPGESRRMYNFIGIH